MIRCRFKANANDPRPVEWPIKHPYWITGYGDDYAWVVAYADDEDEIRRLWPEAEELDSHGCDKYTFTSRFPRPDWIAADQQSESRDGD